MIIFLHIPKCGGSTVHYILEKYYTKDKTLTIKPGIPDTKGNNTIRYLINNQNKILNLSQNCFDNYTLIKGHFLFGIHNDINLNRTASYISFLREPVSRFVSLYQYAIRDRNNAYFNIDKAGVDLEKFVQGKYELDNIATRMVSGQLSKKLNYSDFIRAQENIEKHFKFIGIMELFDQSITMMRHNLSFSKVMSYIPQNRSSKKLQLSSELVSEIEEQEKYDIKLYSIYKQRFEEEWNKNQFRNQFMYLYQKQFNQISKLLGSNKYFEGF